MMSVIKYVIDVALSLMFVPNTNHGNAVMEKNPIIQKHLSAVEEVSAFWKIPTEVQRRPDVAVMRPIFPTGRFAVKASSYFSFSFLQKNLKFFCDYYSTC